MQLPSRPAEGGVRVVVQLSVPAQKADIFAEFVPAWSSGLQRGLSLSPRLG